MIEVTPRIRIPRAEIELSFARSSGPGGQNVNKVNSKACLRWNPGQSPSLPPEARARLLERLASRLTTEGDLVVTSDRFRDQGRNIDDCLEKLRQLILEAITPPKPRKATKPSRGAKRRNRAAKEKRSETKKNRGRIRY